MISGAVLLLALFFFPLWNITLHAPQYPDSIGMNIWINKITDMNPNDVKNINLMNHYIGMKEIPEHMKEFELFPIVVVVMCVLGIAIGFKGQRNMYFAWFILMVFFGITGLYDFYLWEYDYGHDLDPKAAIKIPGQGYQPPLIGSKVILNFTAVSMPRLGALFLFLGIGLSFVAYLLNIREEKQTAG